MNIKLGFLVLAAQARGPKNSNYGNKTCIKWSFFNIFAIYNDIGLDGPSAILLDLITDIGLRNIKNLYGLNGKSCNKIL